MALNRRRFIMQSVATLGLAGAASRLGAQAPAATQQTEKAKKTGVHHANRIALATYSFWQFRNENLRSLETCIDLAADMGFDAVEFLHKQMTDESNDYLQRLKRRAFLLGLDLCGLSIHQGF
jgi:hypothetical protein